jgi:ATP-dependent RNA helicase DDX5/DBP2
MYATHYYTHTDNMEDYIHRIGRTARAGAKGTSVAFFTSKNARNARELAKILQESGNEVPPALLGMSGGGGYGGAAGRPRYSMGSGGRR